MFKHKNGLSPSFMSSIFEIKDASYNVIELIGFETLILPSNFSFMNLETVSNKGPQFMAKIS